MCPSIVIVEYTSPARSLFKKKIQSVTFRVKASSAAVYPIAMFSRSSLSSHKSSVCSTAASSSKAGKISASLQPPSSTLCDILHPQKKNMPRQRVRVSTLLRDCVNIDGCSVRAFTCSVRELHWPAPHKVAELEVRPVRVNSNEHLKETVTDEMVQLISRNFCATFYVPVTSCTCLLRIMCAST